MPDSSFLQSAAYHGARLGEHRGTRLAMHFGDCAIEYLAARNASVLMDRSDRGQIIVRGRDRASWLHNLVTNAVRTIAPGSGRYAFACDVRGRIQFDAVILVHDNELWIDMDRALLPVATRHLDRYLITEDVSLHDATNEFARFALIGPGIAHAAHRLGCPSPSELSEFDLTRPDADTVVFRHDFSGSMALEWVVPKASAARAWDRAAGMVDRPCGAQAVDVLRIEAGIPWPGGDLEGDVLPAETGQIERAVDFHKGCYLGQEIIERMRARGALARRLTRIEVDDGQDLTLPLDVSQGEKNVGRITSLARRPTDARWVGLAYLRASVSSGEALTAAVSSHPVRVVVS